MWRDATALLASLDATRRDIMIVTLAAGLLLAAVLFLIFRSAQARLSRQHEQLIESTRRDALTEMLNHGAIVALLAEAVEAARRDDGRIGVALVDVDNFRLFNDTHGHEAADEVLLRVAELVALEADDGHVARYGPDEFLLVRTGADVAAMEESMERLRAGLEEVSVQFGDSERLPVSVSAGICAYPEHAASVTELLSVAAVAVGEAKGSGGDTVRVAQVGEEERVLSGTLRRAPGPGHRGRQQGPIHEASLGGRRAVCRLPCRAPRPRRGASAGRSTSPACSTTSARSASRTSSCASLRS